MWHFQKALKLVLIAIGVLLAVALLAVIVGLIVENRQASVMLMVPVTVGLIILGIVVNSTRAAARARRAWTMMNNIEQAVRLNLPLPRVIGAMAEDEHGRFALELHQARQALEQGAPVAVVLATVRQLPTHIVELVAAAESVGRLPQVLARILEQRRAAIARNVGKLSFYRSYPLIFIMLLVGVTAMLMIFVMPKYEQIFRDFRTDLPKITQVTLAVAREGAPWALLAMAASFVGLLVMMVTPWRRAAREGYVETVGGWLANRLPWIGRMRLHRALGETLQFAADAIEAGRPIDDALYEAAHVGTNSLLRERVERWISEISRGESIGEAARAARMPRLVCGMLGTATQTSDVAPVLRFLGRYYATRFSRAAMFLEAAFVPVIVGVMGFFVAWLMLSIMAPLVGLINSLSTYPKGGTWP
jgi:type IV pilus assembly protein PilC